MSKKTPSNKPTAVIVLVTFVVGWIIASVIRVAFDLSSVWVYGIALVLAIVALVSFLSLRR